jgi:hypothetical protein
VVCKFLDRKIANFVKKNPGFVEFSVNLLNFLPLTPLSFVCLGPLALSTCKGAFVNYIREFLLNNKQSYKISNESFFQDSYYNSVNVLNRVKWCKKHEKDQIETGWELVRNNVHFPCQTITKIYATCFLKILHFFSLLNWWKNGELDFNLQVWKLKWVFMFSLRIFFN